MNDAISTLVKSLFQKDSLHDCSLEDLQTLAREYPYFTPAQFLLAEKLKSTDEHLYKKQIEKLSLYFTNPLWLDYKVNGYKIESIVQTQQQASHEFMRSTGEEVLEVREDQLQTNMEAETPQEVAASTVTHKETVERPVEIEVKEEQTPFIPETESETGEQIEVPVSKLQDENPQPTPGVQEEDRVQIENGEPNSQLEQLEVQEPLKEQITEPVTENLSSSSDLPGVVAQEDVHTATDEANRDEETESLTLQEEEPMEAQIALPELPDVNQEATETELTFEPYHTVDYFASQGIKFTPEEKPADRFGQQLRSFTEWLKTLKRLSETEAKAPDAAAEEKVKELADHSINKDEVVTETMAEVWVKQGNKEKAIETYQKLSLLNPGKSAYFASLVEQLKNS